MVCQLPQQANPQGLDFHRITFARGSRREIGVHPGEMGWAPNQRRNRDPCGCRWVCRGVIFRDAGQDVADGAASIHRRGIKLPVALQRQSSSQTTANHKGASLVSRLETSLPWIVFGKVPSFSNLANVSSSCSTSSTMPAAKTARANQRIAAPIQKPRITGNDGFAFVPADDELFGRAKQLVVKGEFRTLDSRLGCSRPKVRRV